jgi:hypothetical protein
MITTWIPQGKEKEAGSKYIDVINRIPSKSFEKAILPLGVISKRDGTKVISIVEVKDGNYEKGLNLIMKRMLALSEMNEIHYEVETLMSGEEAMSIIDLGMPKTLPM